MQKILFVTNRNILTTCGELRLIKNRAEKLYVKYGISSDFIVFSSKSRIEAPNKEMINAGGTVKAYRLSMWNQVRTAISYLAIKKEIKCRVESERYKAVVLSGVGMSLFAKSIRKYSGIRIILDIHGALEDTVEAAKNRNLFKKILFRGLFLLEKYALSTNFTRVDGCFVVTQALEEYLKKRYKMKSNVKFYKVPCATSTNVIDESVYQENREFYRRKYGIEENEQVFVYSGGISSWQCIDETIDLYKSISKKLGVKSRMFIFSHSIDSIKDKVADDERFVIDSYKPDELMKVLCAGDFAFLLRKNCPTNNVAFPNKFLEYVQSRMKIIATPYVFEISGQIQTNDIGYLYRFEENINELLDYIKANTGKRNDVIITKQILEENSFENRLNAFAEDLG